MILLHAKCRQASIVHHKVNHSDRSTHRLQGKSDPTDAESAARTVLSGKEKTIPTFQSGETDPS